MQELDKTLLQQLSRLKAPNCPSVADLGEFLDGRGGLEERQLLEAHLRACPSCVNQLIDLRELARLEKEGEEPPPTLVKVLKRLPETIREEEKGSSPSILERITEAVSVTWATVREWTSPRLIGEVVAASAAAVFILVLGPSLLQQQPLVFDRGGEQITALADLSAPEQRMLQALSAIPVGSDSLQKQLVPILEGLSKNLILEQNRGATNVAVNKKAAPATVLVVTDQGMGSGAVISSQGEVLTNWHVLRGANWVRVVFKPQRGVEVRKDLAFAAIPIKVDQVADLALLKIQAPPKNLSVVPLGNIDTVEVGQDVHAIGHPEGEMWTYTTGTISQVRPSYQWTGQDGLLHESKVIQTQTALNPGNSGGPLLNDRAEIIGVNSFRGKGEGLNYAVAVDAVTAFLQRAESRIATPMPSPRASSYRMEHYGPNIVGVYINERVPPPDVWFYLDSGGQLVYAAMGNRIATQIDTVIREDASSQSSAHYSDFDCDGKVDLIGFDSNGDGTPDRDALPQGSLRLASLAPQLFQAFQQGLIPYPQIQVCR